MGYYPDCDDDDCSATAMCRECDLEKLMSLPRGPTLPRPELGWTATHCDRCECEFSWAAEPGSWCMECAEQWDDAETAQRGLNQISAAIAMVMLVEQAMALQQYCLGGGVVPGDVTLGMGYWKCRKWKPEDLMRTLQAEGSGDRDLAASCPVDVNTP